MWPYEVAIWASVLLECGGRHRSGVLPFTLRPHLAFWNHLKLRAHFSLVQRWRLTGLSTEACETWERIWSLRQIWAVQMVLVRVQSCIRSSSSEKNKKTNWTHKKQSFSINFQASCLPQLTDCLSNSRPWRGLKSFLRHSHWLIGLWLVSAAANCDKTVCGKPWHSGGDSRSLST